MKLSLQPFDSTLADLIVSWVHNERELRWLAPRCRWPLTAETVQAWRGPLNSLHQLTFDGQADPIGYAEINHMPKNRHRYWLGHIILDPHVRRRGVGVTFVQLLLREAFECLNARQVSLVVLPDNVPAIRCYQRTGFVHARDEYHRFAADRRVRVARMDITRDRWLDAIVNRRNVNEQDTPQIVT